MMEQDEPQKPAGRAAFVATGRGNHWPWKQTTTGFFGLVVLAALACGTAWWAVGHFESRLDKNVRADLASAGVDLDTLQLDWDYRDLSITGELTAGVSEQQVIDLLRSADNGGVRDISLRVLPATFDSEPASETGKIELTATLSDGVMTLKGTVLTAAQRSQIYEAAALALGPDNVRRQIEVSGLQEAIPGADQRVQSFATSIAGLDPDMEVDAMLSATDFRFNATVDNENEVVDLLQRRGGAGDVGLVISGDIIAKKSVPGAVFDVRARKADDRITLSGVVTSEQQRQRLFESATLVAADGVVVDELTVAAGAAEEKTAERMQLILDALNTFPAAETANAHITGNLFEFDSMVEFEEQSAAMLAVQQAASENGMEVSGEIESRKISLVREVALLQQEIDLLTDEIRENVVFEASSPGIGFKAKQTLDKLVDAMNRYQRTVLLISGYTDSSGDSADNERLSLERAGTVRQYFEVSGIDQSRLLAVGLGEANPIASNDTPADRQKNRRVEFTARSDFDN